MLFTSSKQTTVEREEEWRTNLFCCSQWIKYINPLTMNKHYWQRKVNTSYFFSWLLKQRISIAKLCFQMCFEFDNVSLTFIKDSDEYAIKLLCLFFNIAFSVLQISFELETKQRRKACQRVARSHARHAVPQQCARLWTRRWASPCACTVKHPFSMYLGFCFSYHKRAKWGIEGFSKFICLSFCLNKKYQTFHGKERHCPGSSLIWCDCR